METFFAIVFILFIGAVIGWYAREQAAVNTINKLLAEADERVEERIKIRIEKHNGVMYAYGVDKEDFLGQGTTLTEIDEILVAKFPGQQFAIKESNLAELDLKL